MKTIAEYQDAGGIPAEEKTAAEHEQHDARVKLVFATLLTGLCIAVPAAIMEFVLPLNQAELNNASVMEVREVWWPFFFAGIALSLGSGLAGIVLAVRSRVAATEVAEAQNVKTSSQVATRMRFARPLGVLVLTLGVLALIAGLVVYFTLGGSMGFIRGLSLVGLGLVVIMLGRTSIVLATRCGVTAYWMAAGACLALLLAILALMAAPVAYIWGNNVNLGRSLVGLGLVGIAVAAWGVGASDPAVTRKWFLPISVMAVVLSLPGNLYMFILFMMLESTLL